MHFFNCKNCNCKVKVYSLLLLQGPLRFRAAGFHKGLQFLMLLTQQRLDQSLAQALGEAQLEDYAMPCLLYLAVRRAEERVVTRTAVNSVRMEVACAVVLRHHAALLPYTSGIACHDVMSQLESTGIDVDVSVLGKNRLGLHLEIPNENVLFAFHFFELFARRSIQILAPTP